MGIGYGAVWDIPVTQAGGPQIQALTALGFHIYLFQCVQKNISTFLNFICTLGVQNAHIHCSESVPGRDVTTLFSVPLASRQPLSPSLFTKPLFPFPLFFIAFFPFPSFLSLSLPSPFLFEHFFPFHSFSYTFYSFTPSTSHTRET